jgi:hypothetical protein
MHPKRDQTQSQALWQALSPRQQQQLLTLLSRWTLREVQHIVRASPALLPGGHNEHQQRESAA